ncbi:hypothetical protein Goshw_002977, partial [Gossypium schwendimanii]|nr:hypothetical protein [Gossypium schwendimanii]
MEADLENLNLEDEEEEEILCEKNLIEDENEHQLCLVGKASTDFLGQGREGYAYFRYERLTLFCFLCGKLGHGEGFCQIRKTIEIKEVSFGWNSSFRAPSRTELSSGSFSSKWYTWERGRLPKNNVRERIDRGVANQAWWECFPGSYELLFNPYGFLFSSYELLFSSHELLLSSYEFLLSFRASVNDVLKSIIGSLIGLEDYRSYITLSIESIGTFECFDFGYNGMYRYAAFLGHDCARDLEEQEVVQ